MKRTLSLNVLAACAWLASTPAVLAQEHVLRLYDGTPPNSRSGGQEQKVEHRDITWVTRVQDPDIAVYLPTKRFATGQAVVICPGGGYGGLAYDLEGSEIARYLNSIGVAGIVLRYRLPSTESSIEPHGTPLMDAKRAMRLVRHNASAWNVQPDRIGVMGFSAGGHLAASLGTHFDRGDAAAADPVERESSRPDFMVLMYPVISFSDPIAHRGTRANLLGSSPDPELLDYYSLERQVTGDTPPAFLVHAGDDTAVPVENSLLMYEALRRQRVPAELHVLTEGGHGFGLALRNPHVASWTLGLKLWLQALATSGARR